LEGWQLRSLGFFAVGAVSHLAGVWLLAPRFGAMGAAASFCVAQALMALVAPLMSAKTRLAAVTAWRSFSPARIWS
jgi:O-antigen/teichoic acid export membrane protein